MGALSDVIKDMDRRRAVVDDGVKAIEAEVADKRGMRGAAVKMAFRVVKGVKPGFLGMAMDHLLDDFAVRIDPHYEAGAASGDVKRHFGSNASSIADSLLGVTDARAQRAKNKAIKKAYSKLRPQAVEHVVAAMPRVADLVIKHTA